VATLQSKLTCTFQTAISSEPVPSGASTGIYEALELRDNDPNRFNGKGCLQAVSNIHTLLEPALIGLDVTKQEKIDKVMVEQVDAT